MSNIVPFNPPDGWLYTSWNVISLPCQIDSPLYDHFHFFSRFCMELSPSNLSITNLQVSVFFHQGPAVHWHYKLWSSSCHSFLWFALSVWATTVETSLLRSQSEINEERVIDNNSSMSSFLSQANPDVECSQACPQTYLHLSAHSCGAINTIIILTYRHQVCPLHLLQWLNYGALLTWFFAIVWSWSQQPYL